MNLVYLMSDAFDWTMNTHIPIRARSMECHFPQTCVPVSTFDSSINISMRWSLLLAYIWDFYCVSENPVHHSFIVILNYYHIHAHIIVSWFSGYCYPAAVQFNSQRSWTETHHVNGVYAQRTICYVHIISHLRYTHTYEYAIQTDRRIDYYHTLMFLSFNFDSRNSIWIECFVVHISMVHGI